MEEQNTSPEQENTVPHEATEAFENRIDLKPLQDSVEQIKKEIAKIIVGQNDMIELLIISILTNGHALIEGVPGVAKTVTAKLLAKTMAVDFNRIQFTPDLMPSDILGTSIFNVKTNYFEYKKGPIFSNIVLIDEINRAPAKVQSALLEAMQEKQVTIGDETFKLKPPFLVMATQNPVEQEGTYPLPEAQVDRFMLKVIIDYPNLSDEQAIVRANLNDSFGIVKPVISTAQISKAQKAVRKVYMDEKIEKYILDLVFATRYPEKYKLQSLKPLISFGASPRGSINLATAAKCYAFIKRRGYVIPEDVRAVVYDVLRHRIGITYEAEAENVSSEDIIQRIVNAVEVP